MFSWGNFLELLLKIADLASKILALIGTLKQVFISGEKEKKTLSSTHN